MCSTSPKAILSICSCQSALSWASCAAVGCHKKAVPIRRSASGTSRRPSTGIHSTHCNLLRTLLVSQVSWWTSSKGVVHTKVVSSGRPRASSGIVFNSTPSSGKSCRACEPALAPNALSSSCPTQPLLRRKSCGTVKPCCAASSAKLSPASELAFSNSCRSCTNTSPILINPFIHAAIMEKSKQDVEFIEGARVIDAEGFRANVGIIICNEQGQVFWARRFGQHSWQFPQGGIDVGETPEQAMYRELWEEVGLKPEQVEIIYTSRNWLRYRLPKRLVRREQRPTCIGQKQKWFLLRLKCSEKDVNVMHSMHPEFDDWRWVSYWYPVRQIGRASCRE